MDAAAIRDAPEQLVDFHLAAFASALYSLHPVSSLIPVPLPQVFLNKDTHECDIARLRAFFNKFKNAREIKQNFDSLEHQALDFLLELHYSKQSYKDQLRVSLLQLISESFSGIPVHTRFRVCNTTPEKERRFQAEKFRLGSRMGFHGSSSEKWYSIIRNELQVMSTDPVKKANGSIFGEGIYLSSEIEVALSFAPYGKGWDNSIKFQNFSCVAVCEYIDRRVPFSSSSNSKKNFSLSDDPPDHYILVQDSDDVIIRELIVIGSKKNDVNPNRLKELDKTFYFYLVLLFAVLCFYFKFF